MVVRELIGSAPGNPDVRPRSDGQVTARDTFWTKDHSNFKVRGGSSLEPPFHEQQTFLTPNDQFFVCNAGPTPQIDISTYRLIIEGDAVSRRLELSYNDLRSMEQRIVPAFLECAGNQRILFQTVLGETLNKRPHLTETLWGFGAVGMAEWKGVPLCRLLELAGIRPQAVHVCPEGADFELDGERVRCPMPVLKALDPNTLIALEMNGEPLAPDHGFPARVLVPGWIGTHSIKWVQRIVVSSRFLWVYRNTQLYVLMGNNWPEENYAPAKGAPISEQSIKSSLTLEYPAKLSQGEQTIFGFARSPDSKIRAVEWSHDGGNSWEIAEIVSPNVTYGWVRFAFCWNPVPGDYSLMTRAYDEAGRVQPIRGEFNSGGYLFNVVHPHPVRVSD